MKLKCDCLGKPGLKLIVPKISEANDVLIYHSCIANTYTAMRRDALAMPTADPVMVTEFDQYVESLMETEIIPILQDFDYDYNCWYNRLDNKQQKRIDAVKLENLKMRQYKMFCKLEKQEITSDVKNPKNRCICGPNEEYKYVMGPVVHALELLFKKRFKGYCSGRSWEEKEKVMNMRKQLGLIKTAQGDGSGFDRTQHIELKQSVEMRIYKWLAEHGKIKHVDVDTFLSQAMREDVEIIAATMEKLGKWTYFRNLGKVIKRGTVQSGNCDTSFGNTMRMCLYNRYIVEVLMKIEKTAYDLDAAGDDFCINFDMNVTNQEIQEAYAKAFVPATTMKNFEGQHGLGQVLKFMKIGSIEETDFCSTETFWSQQQQSYKITRKLDRFLTLTCYSRKALSMSKAEQKQYMMDLYNSNLEWMRGLPILTEYNDLLKHFSDKIELTQQEIEDFQRVNERKERKIRNKIRLPEKPEYTKMYDNLHHERFTGLLSKFGKDDAYAMMDRVSDKTGCAEDYYIYLSKIYGISRGEAEQIQRRLVKAKDQPLQNLIDLPELKWMLSNKQSRDERLMDYSEQPLL